MTAIVRTLPGLVNDDTRATAAIPVMQVIDHDKADYDVRLDLSAHIDIHAFARAVYADPAALTEWTIAMRNPHVRGIMAAANLRQNTAIRAALTITVTPAEAGLAADCLSERLAQAALEPQRCEHWDGDCNWFAVEGEAFCPEHLADVAEHGLPGDRGTYDQAQG